MHILSCKVMRTSMKSPGSLRDDERCGYTAAESRKSRQANDGGTRCTDGKTPSAANAGDIHASPKSSV